MNMSYTSDQDPLHEKPVFENYQKIQDPEHKIEKSKLQSPHQNTGKRKNNNTNSYSPSMFDEPQNDVRLNWKAPVANPVSSDAGAASGGSNEFRRIKPKTSTQNDCYNPEIALEALRAKDIEKVSKKYGYASKEQLTFIIQMTLRQVCSKNQFMASDRMYVNIIEHADVWVTLLMEHIAYMEIHKRGTDEALVMSYIKGMNSMQRASIQKYLQQMQGFVKE
jgi:hypothetical protein